LLSFSDSDHGDNYMYDTSYRPEEDEAYGEEYDSDSGDLSELSEEEEDLEIKYVPVYISVDINGSKHVKLFQMMTETLWKCDAYQKKTCAIKV